MGIRHRGKVPGQRLALGQLVYYRTISADKTSAAAQAGIFAGWRVEAGLKYRGVLKVLSYTALKNQTGNFWEPLSVPEPEIFVPNGEPTFPLRNIAEDAIKKFEDPALTDLNDLESDAIPWVSEHVPASAPRPRHASITFNRTLEIGPTLTCRGC